MHLPALTGRGAPSAEDCELVALPARLGGLGLINPTKLGDNHTNSAKVSVPLVALIIQQKKDLGDIPGTQHAIMSTIRHEQRIKQEAPATELHRKLPHSLQCTVELASEKGAST